MWIEVHIKEQTVVNSDAIPVILAQQKSLQVTGSNVLN